MPRIDVLRRSSTHNPVHVAQVEATKQGQLPTLQKAVVVEVFSDIDVREDFLLYVKNRVTNPYVAGIAPVNSVVAKIISNSAGNAQTNFVILFPLFSSHLQLPISTGEVVNAIFTDGGTSGNSGIGFWIDIARAGKMADDVNFTHYDRIYDPTNDIENYDTQDISDIGGTIRFGNLVFNNGPEHSGVYTLSQPDPAKNPYNILVASAFTNKFSSIEVVPRWNKRPNEFVLQGKNNSLILLGEDRHGSLRGAFEPDANNKFDNRGGSAIIDMVVGRGRLPKTAANIALNERQGFETDKVSFKYGKQQNPNEGDPDYNADAARILIAQNSKLDELFDLTTITTPTNVYPIVQPEILAGRKLDVDNMDGQINSPSTNNSYAVVKADQVRIIARQSSEQGAAANGSILLIHEGNRDEKDELTAGNGVSQTQDAGLAMVMINEEGVHVNGKFVHLGPARDHAQPAVLWSNYVEIVNELQGQIKETHKLYGEQVMALQSSVLMLCTTLAQVFLSSNVCPPGGPNAAIAAAAGILQATGQQIAQANAVGSVAQGSLGLLQKQADVLQKAAADKQSKIVFVS